MASDLNARDEEGLPEMAWRPPSPDLGPQAQGHIEHWRMGFFPHSGEAEWGDLPPLGPSSFTSYP